MIDFKEIPSNPKDGDPDTFEKFCSNFLKAVGYEVMDIPSRGADGGIDLKVRDLRRKPDGSFRTKEIWLVSCKHYAHSGNNVGLPDEPSITDRIIQHGCTGFMGFYSTGPTTSLITRLKGIKFPFIIYYDREIENEIVGFYSRENLFMRYFPDSYQKWKSISNLYEPVKLFESLIDSKYSYVKSFLITSYGSLGVALKQIRQHESFKDVFEKNNVTYQVNEEIPKITATVMNGYTEWLKQLPGGLQQVLDECDEKIPGFLPPGPEAVFAILSYFFGIVIEKNLSEITNQLLDSIGETGSYQKPIQFSFGLNQDMFPEGINEYCLFTNYFICSPNCHNNLEKVFLELKSEIQ